MRTTNDIASSKGRAAAPLCNSLVEGRYRASRARVVTDGLSATPNPLTAHTLDNLPQLATSLPRRAVVHAFEPGDRLRSSVFNFAGSGVAAAHSIRLL